MEFEGRLKKGISGQFPDFGAIFMSNASTREECFKRNLFGLPLCSADFVHKVKVGMILFLFEYEKRELWGVFKATSDGELDIIPHAYSSTGKRFPAQVTFTTIWSCHPLQEHEFRDAIRDNYYATNKFNFGLSKDQVRRLLWLFDSRKIRPFQPERFMDSQTRKRYREPSPKKRETEEDMFTRTKSAKKKLNEDIDNFSLLNAESLEDYIPLFSSDSDSSECLMEDTCQLTVNCQEDNSSDFILKHASVRGLYSDSSNNRSNVFSRLNFSSRVQDREDDASADNSVQEIMEELETMHDKQKERVRRKKTVRRKKPVRMTPSVGRQNEMRNVFLRISVPDVQDNGISTSSKERRQSKRRSMTETECPVSGGMKASVFSRLSWR